MKLTSKIFASAITCVAVLSCAVPFATSADVDNYAQAEMFLSDPYAAFSALGYTSEQIQTIMDSSVSANQYLAYCMFDPNIGYTGSTLMEFKVNRPAWIGFNGFVLGSLCASEEGVPIIDHTTDNILYHFDSDVIYFSTDTSNLNEYQFPNIIRGKYTGTASTSSFTVTTTQTQAAFIKGTVEAGNVSRYISGSTDTGSIINSSDATLVLQHFGNMMAGIADPNWTYAASIAADVNCDNQVNAVDAMLITNRVMGSINSFWDTTPLS